MSVGSHDNANTGEIGGGEIRAHRLAPDAFKPDGFPVPCVVAEDPVGLGNGVPAFQIGKFLPRMFPCLDKFPARSPAQLADLGFGEGHVTWS